MMDFFGPVLNAVITWLLVVFGWIVVADQQRSQNLREHAVSRIDKLKTRVDVLEAKGIALHAEQYSKGAALEIIKELQNTALELRYLRSAGAIDDGWISLMIALRQAITRKNFEEKTYKLQATDGDIVREIYASHAAIATFLLDAQVNKLSERRSLIESLKSLF